MADENTENTPSEPTPIEQRAMEQGWVPEDQWDGEPEAWRPAKEFVDRGELFKKIDEVKRENKQLKQGIDELSKHHAKVREVEYQRALATLKAQKRDALADGDADKVVEIDERIDATKEAQRQSANQPQQQAEAVPDPRFEAWVNKNTWYNNDRIMKAAADEVARELVLRGERDNARILTEVEKRIKQEFPQKFTNPNREKASAVEGSTNKSTTRKTDTVEMSDVEKTIMNKILRVTPGLTKEKYLEEFKSTR